jgi:hypothetical protein
VTLSFLRESKISVFEKKEKKKNFEIPQKGRVEGHNVEMYLLPPLLLPAS